MPRLFLIVICLAMIAPLSAQSIALTEEALPIWEQAMRQPDDFGVACMPLQAQSQTVLYNAARFPLASVSKLLIFIEYAVRLDAGQIRLDEMVSTYDLERYDLARTDRGAHDRFMATYPDNISSVSLWDVATEGMMQYSSNAAADYVLARLSPVDWPTLYARLGVYDASVPTPLTMIPLLMNNHIDGRATHDSLTTLSIDLGQEYLNLYVHDRVWRQAEVDYRAQQPSTGHGWSRWPDWDVQAEILQQDTSTASVLDFRNVLNAIYNVNSTALSTNVQYIVRQGLRWDHNEFITANYAEYGSKLGFYSGGTLTMVGYGEPYHGQPVISVIFLRNVPQRTYNALLRENSISEFAHWLNINACAGLNAMISDQLVKR